MKSLVLIDLFIDAGSPIAVTEGKPDTAVKPCQYENVICAKKSSPEKIYKQFLDKNEIGAARFFLNFNSFLNFKNFHIFLVEFLNITSADKNGNMHIFYKLKFQS